MIERRDALATLEELKKKYRELQEEEERIAKRNAEIRKELETLCSAEHVEQLIGKHLNELQRLKMAQENQLQQL